MPPRRCRWPRCWARDNWPGHRGVDDVRHRRLQHHLLLRCRYRRFLGDQEPRAHVGQVRAQVQRGADGAAGGHRTGQQHRTVIVGPHFLDEGERVHRAAVSAGTRADQHQAVHTAVECLARELHVRHVVEHQTTPGVHGLHHRVGLADRGDDDRHAVASHAIEIRLHARVGGVKDEVHAVRPDAAVRIRRTRCRERRADARQPTVQFLGGARIQRREGADDAGEALRRHQRLAAGQEHGRADERQRQAILQQGRQGQAVAPVGAALSAAGP